MSNPPPAVAFNAVSKSFGERKVLRDVSFSVAPGTAFVLLGRSGSGKSVTLKLLCGLLAADSGAVSVNGTDITGMTSNQLVAPRSHIGFLFQSAALFDSFTVGENIAFPLRRRAQKKDTDIRAHVQDLLTKVGLPDEYNTMPSALSGGMKKRAGLARALAISPSLLLVDEPSAGLDPITSLEIDQLLMDIKHKDNTTLVVVTHNIPSARRIADSMAFLDQGQIVATGTVDEMQQSELDLVHQFMQSEQAG